MGEPATIKPPITETEVVGDIGNHIDDLEVVINGICKPLTISINGEWGAGKTTFLKHWQKRKPNNSIFIDAFATDFINNPLAVILSEFSEYFKEEELFKKLQGKKLDFETITKNSFAELVKLLTVSLVDLKDSTKESPINGTIDDFRKFNQAIVEFKKLISERKHKKEKLYIFVDELDRCRPTYAVEFIEIVKHFFEIDNTVFIFAINKKELCSSIKHVQGCENPDRYLKKFFNFNYDLPTLSSKDFIQYLVSKNEFGIEINCCDEDFINTFAFFAEKLELHPRDIKQCFETLIIALKKIGPKRPCHFIYPLIFLTIIRECKKEWKDSYAEWVGFNLRSKNPPIDFNKFIPMKLSDIESKIHQIWMELSLNEEKTQRFRSRSRTLDTAIQNVESQPYGRVITKMELAVQEFHNKNQKLFDKLPTEASNYQTLAQYIDSLLNFSNKFTKEEP